MPDAKRIADGEHQITNFKTVAIVEFERGKFAVAAFEFQNRDIELVVLRHHLGVKLALVGKCDADFGFAARLDDVSIGDDDAFRIDDDAGAQRTHDPFRWLAKVVAEETPEPRVIGKWRVEGLHARTHVDVDNSWRCLAHNRGIGKLRGFARWRHDFGFRQSHWHACAWR